MDKNGRRDFLKWCLFSASALTLSCYGLNRLFPLEELLPGTGYQCSYYEKLENSQVRCLLCHHNCLIRPGKSGVCLNRVNRKGTLYSKVYNLPAALAVDPVEKEPLYHFLPGSNMLCIGSAGCNFACKYCQNWQLSQQEVRELGPVESYTASEIIELADRRKVKLISFTYNEPTVLYEYMYDIAAMAFEHGLKVVMHTNGFINPKPLAGILPLLSAVTVDLKSFSERFYSEVTGGSLAPVLENLLAMRSSGVWLELVNLVVPGFNDDQDEIGQMASWIAENLGTKTPLHFSRFFPSYRLTDLSPTPLSTLEAAYLTAKQAGLNYVTLGNVPGHCYNSTYCPVCGALLVERNHISVENLFIEKGCCPVCKEEIPGIWH